MSRQSQTALDEALSRLPEWQPPPGFAARVAAHALAGRCAAFDIALVLRGLGTAVLVALGLWLGAEVLVLLVAESGSTLTLSLGSFALASGVLLLSLRHGRRSWLAGV